MHLLTIADELKQMNGEISSFVATTMTVASMLESGVNNEMQQQVLADQLRNAIARLSKQLWSSEND